MTEIGAMPRWDVTALFPSLESPQFLAALEKARQDVAALAVLFDARAVRRREGEGTRERGNEGTRERSLLHSFTPSLAPSEAAVYEEVTGRLNTLLQELRTLRAFVSAFVSTDAANETAQARQSELRGLDVTMEKLRTRYTAWLGSLDVDTLLSASAVAREHEFVIRKAQVLARHQMVEGEESLAAELRPAGSSGWARLHHDLSALLTVRLNLRGEQQTLPMSAVRALASDPDREVRRAAYEAELKAWEAVAVPVAAALNGIKGYQSVLHRRRGFPDDVASTLLSNNVDRQSLEAMQAACVASFPDFARYMRAKARSLGLDRLGWYDLNAPVGEETRRYPWREAETFLLDQFARYSDRMAAFAERSFRDAWIDAEPRAGKEGGGFCMQIRPGESRILMNYDGSFNGVSTLAHELGHAYHNLNLEARTQLQSQTPSTLAETASIFCETLAFDAALRSAQGPERLALLEASLQRDLMVVVDIHSRFLFEKEVFERRVHRELSPREFCERMLECQRQTYGDALDPDAMHPYMWAVKGHYYGPTFYNYPYTFGLLFALGLYARYQEAPEPFRAGYDDLLASTGLADAATLARRFQIDLHSPAFWRASLDVICAKIAEFERMV